ncbi:MAG TPA: CRISPR-associated endoribonuclease Cas6 [Candidatus Cryosericum sp.]|nr:CRISPR-associated endoribonuclease Cas6 [Candidatus Cryosericum sp.]
MLPEHYNYIVQSYLYASLSTALASRLHDEGWEFGKRRFKMFVFSQLYAQQLQRTAHPMDAPGQPSQPRVNLGSPCWFLVGSPEEQILQELAQSLLHSGEGRLGSNAVRVTSVALLAPLQLEPGPIQTLRVRTLSPITVYKTDERRHTVYFSPHDAAFSAYIRENARRKFTAYTGREPDVSGFDIRPLDQRDHAVTVIFKGTRIRGHTGRFELSGSGELLRFLYDAGLGSKNSEGCGMIEIE